MLTAEMLALNTEDLREFCSILRRSYKVDPAHIYVEIKIPTALTEEEYADWKKRREDPKCRLYMEEYPTEYLGNSLYGWAELQHFNAMSIKSAEIEDLHPPIGAEMHYAHITVKNLTGAEIVAGSEFRKKMTETVKSYLKETNEQAEIYAAMAEAGLYAAYRKLYPEKDEDTIRSWVKIELAKEYDGKTLLISMSAHK